MPGARKFLRGPFFQLDARVIPGGEAAFERKYEALRGNPWQSVLPEGICFTRQLNIGPRVNRTICRIYMFNISRSRLRSLISRANSVRARSRKFLQVEPLEQRDVPATFLVTTTLDAGTGSLRQAILDANNTPGADLITFDVGEGGAGDRPAERAPGDFGRRSPGRLVTTRLRRRAFDRNTWGQRGPQCLGVDYYGSQ